MGLEVISLTKDKVWQTNYNNENAFCKKTTIDEVNNLRKVESFFKNNNCKILNDFTLKVPQIYSWDGSCLTMEECKGQNLEIMLRTMGQREEGKKFLNAMLNFMLNNNFYWHDFAPRNILVNQNEKEISIVDFERGIKLEGLSFINYVRDFIRENVYEEYAAFLLPSERVFEAKKIFSLNNDEIDYDVDLKKVKSKRVKNIAQKLHLPTPITYSKYLEIIYMLIKAETPYCRNAEVIFPIVELEDILLTSGYNDYTNEILKRNNMLELEGVSR